MSDNMVRICEYCGTALPPGAKVCPACEAVVSPIGGDAPEALNESIIPQAADPVAPQWNRQGQQAAGPVAPGWNGQGQQAAGQTPPQWNTQNNNQAQTGVNPMTPQGNMQNNMQPQGRVTPAVPQGNMQVSAESLNETVRVRHAAPMPGSMAGAGAQNAMNTGGMQASGFPAQDLDSTMRVRHAQPMQGANGGPYTGNMQPGMQAGRQAPGRADALQPGYGGRTDPGMNRRGPAPSAPERPSVGSFGGSPQAGAGGMNATERRAAELARSRQAGRSYPEKKKSGALVPILIAILIVLLILAVLAIRILL